MRDNSEQTFECAAAGHPQPNVFFWVVNGGMEEKSFSRFKTVTVVRRSRNIPFQISCRAESEYQGRTIGSEKSTRHLDVLWGPEMQLGYDERESISIDEGKDFTIVCPFDGYPKPDFTWILYQEDHGVEKSSGSARYTIENASPKDNGKWTCSATNPNTGEQESRSTFVNVQLKPQFTSEPIQQLGKNKTRPIVMCAFQYQFSSESFRQIKWSIKNETHDIPLFGNVGMTPSEPSQIAQDSRFRAKWTDVTGNSATSVLTLNDATQEEIDMDFVCQVKNSVGISGKEFGT